MNKEITFRSTDLPLSAYLYATRKLRFLGCELLDGSDRLIAFLFDDPRNQGPELQREFEAGAECAAVTFYESIRRLRRIMDQTKINRRAEQNVRHYQHR